MRRTSSSTAGSAGQAGEPVEELALVAQPLRAQPVVVGLRRRAQTDLRLRLTMQEARILAQRGDPRLRPSCARIACDRGRRSQARAYSSRPPVPPRRLPCRTAPLQARRRHRRLLPAVPAAAEPRHRQPGRRQGRQGHLPHLLQHPRLSPRPGARPRASRKKDDNKSLMDQVLAGHAAAPRPRRRPPAVPVARSAATSGPRSSASRRSSGGHARRRRHPAQAGRRTS